MVSGKAVSVISLVKRTEPQANTVFRDLRAVQLWGLSVQGGRFLSPEEFVWPSSARSIEFVGDSDTAAFGNLSRKTGLLDGIPHMSVFQQDVNRGFPFMLGRAFAAEIQVVHTSSAPLLQVAHTLTLPRRLFAGRVFWNRCLPVCVRHPKRDDARAVPPWRRQRPLDPE